MKGKFIIGGITILALAGLFLIGQHRQNQRQAYAKANNCTWYATGSMYGDDRDFICKPNKHDQEVRK